MEESHRDIKLAEEKQNSLESRAIFVFDMINDQMAKNFITRLIELETKRPEEDIKVFINSPGGYVTSLLSMIDAMRLVAPDVCTYCVGEASSAAAVLLVCGTPGKRYITRNSRVLLHQIRAGTSGHISDMKIRVEESDRVNKQLMKLIIKHTKIKQKDLKHLIDRDCWLVPTQALKYDLVDEII